MTLQKKRFGAAFLKNPASRCCVKRSSITGRIAAFTKCSYRPVLKLRFVMLRLRLQDRTEAAFLKNAALDQSGEFFFFFQYILELRLLNTYRAALNQTCLELRLLNAA